MNHEKKQDLKKSLKYALIEGIILNLIILAVEYYSDDILPLPLFLLRMVGIIAFIALINFVVYGSERTRLRQEAGRKEKLRK